MSVQSVERTFAIIELLSAESKPQQLSSIAKACMLPPATAHRLLDTLCKFGYVKNDIGGFYSLTPRLFSITSNSVIGTSLISVAKPHLDELSDLVNESVHLVLRDDCDIVYVYKVVKSIGSLQMASHIGMRLPMYTTAAGKAILSTLPEPEVRRIFNKSAIRPVTENTITNIDDLLQSLSVTQKLGYSLDNEENEIGITCIAMPLGKGPDGAKYAFSISSLTRRMQADRLNELEKIMKKTQTNILSELVSI